MKLLFFCHLFDSIFLFRRFTSGIILFLINELHRTSYLRVFCSLVCMVVFENTPFDIGRDSSIERIVGATENVGEIHANYMSYDWVYLPKLPVLVDTFLIFSE